MGIIMLNWIWGIMIVAGTVYGILSGNTEELSEGFMEGAQEGVSLAITMAGVMGLWCGLMEIAGKAGLMKSLEKKLSLVIRFLFPTIPKGHIALEYISVNFVANIFGLAGAATPSGLKAMEYLAQLQDKKQKVHIASREMCTFLIINVSSLQLIPINMIAYRSQYGSVYPSAITAPAIIATFVSTITAIIFCKIMSRR